MDFATLTPCNATAIRLLRQAISHMSVNEKADAPLRFIQTHDTVPDVLADSSHDGRPTEIVKFDPSSCEDASYVLSLTDEKLPHDPTKGWIVGCSSNVTEAGPMKVDFLIAKPLSEGEENIIAPIQLIFQIHKRSGILTYTPLNEQSKVEVLVDGEYKTIQYGQRQAITSSLTNFRFGGRAVYRLLFSVVEKNLNFYQDHLMNIVKSITGAKPDHLLSFAPSNRMRVFENMKICLNPETLDAGSFGWVSEGFSFDGEPLAIKELIVRSRSSYDAVRKEFAIASLFTSSEFVTNCLNLWCEHDSDTVKEGPCLKCLRKGYHTIRLYMSAHLARGSFWDVLVPRRAPIAYETRFQLFYQAFQGLSDIWSAEIIHRDISPSNILVVSLDPAQASITDFGKAKHYREGERMYDTKIGPIPFVAPEVWSGGGYDKSIDLYSLALSIAVTFELPPTGWWPNERVTEKKLEEYTTGLGELARRKVDLADLVHLLQLILKWNAEDRITLEQALQHKCWSEVSFRAETSKRLKTSEGSTEERTPITTDPFSPSFYNNGS